MIVPDSHVPAFMSPVGKNIGLMRILREGVVENRTTKKQRHPSGMPFVFCTMSVFSIHNHFLNKHLIIHANSEHIHS